jgi:hypothetical protein
MRVYLATWLEDNQGVTLTKAGATNRLLSFFFLLQREIDLEGYVENGSFLTKKGATKSVPTNEDERSLGGSVSCKARFGQKRDR